jgi:hypothetical protein
MAREAFIRDPNRLWDAIQKDRLLLFEWEPTVVTREETVAMTRRGATFVPTGLTRDAFSEETSDSRAVPTVLTWPRGLPRRCLHNAVAESFFATLKTGPPSRA